MNEPTNTITDQQRLGFFRLGTDFQPVIGLSDGSLFACEALVRGWSFENAEGEESDLAPADLFGMAFSNGLVPALDELCWQTAATEGAPIAQCGTTLFLNVMGETIEAGSFAVARLRQITVEQGITPNLIALDLVDPCSQRDGWDLARMLEPWRTEGWALSLDSNGPPDIALAEQVRPAYVKISAHHLDTPEHSEPMAALVGKLHSMGIQVIAKRVECDRQAELCRELGFDFLQGFLFPSSTGQQSKAPARAAA